LSAQSDVQDPLARAARNQRAGRFAIAIAIVMCLCITPFALGLVDRLLPGLLPVWIALVWLVAIVLVALAAEHAVDGEHADVRTGEEG
jgi:flagellar biosynthesis protein FliR